MITFISTVTVQNTGTSSIRLDTDWVSQLIDGYVQQYFSESLIPRTVSSITAISFDEFQMWKWKYDRRMGGTILFFLLDTDDNKYRHIYSPSNIGSFKQWLIYKRTAYRTKHPKVYV